MTRLLAVLSMLLLSCAAHAHAQSRIARARSEVSDGDSSSHAAARSHTDADGNTDEHIRGHAGCGFFCQLIGGLFSTASANQNVSVAVDQDLAPALTAHLAYAPYPYSGHEPGYLVPQDQPLALRDHFSDVPRYRSRPHNDYALQMSSEAGYYDGLARFGVSLRLLTPTSLELDTRLLWLHEWSSDAVSAPGQYGMTLGATHLDYRFGEGELFMLRLGIGARYLVDGANGAAGAEVLFGSDVFLGRPFILSFELTAGTLGQAGAFSARAQLGVMLGRSEMFASYEVLAIGDVLFPSPMLGVRVWF